MPNLFAPGYLSLGLHPHQLMRGVGAVRVAFRLEPLEAPLLVDHSLRQAVVRPHSGRMRPRNSKKRPGLPRTEAGRQPSSSGVPLVVRVARRTLPRWGSRVRIPSSAPKIKKVGGPNEEILQT